MLGPIRELPRPTARDLLVAALVAVASFGAGLAFAGTADAARVDEPSIDAVACASECRGEAAVVGSAIELTGAGLAEVRVVKFPGREERRVKAKPESTSDELVEVTLPQGAATGRPRVVDAARNKATAPNELEVAAGDAPASDPAPQGPGAAPPTGIDMDPAKGFFKGKRRATGHLASGSATELDVVSADGAVVATVPVKDDGTGEAIAKWDGVTDAGDVAPNGEYAFDGGGDAATFEQYDHIFPVNGPAEWGDGLGAGRNHQGQDLFADCGTKLVAARAGKVEHVDTHSAAGNYLVVDGKKTDADYVYMHLQEPAPFAAGDRVKTGQAIGSVGETGNASGCHLHFELWDSGWQQGSPANATAALEKWDDWS